MNQSHKLLIRTAVALATSAAICAAMPGLGAAARAHEDCRPSVSALPDLGFGGEAVAFNRHGVFVGGVANANGDPATTFEAAWWDRWGRLQVLDTGLLGSEVNDINARGEMVGNGYDPVTGALRSYVLIHGRQIFLRGLGGTFTRARRINQRGEIAGTATTSGDAGLFAVRWSSPDARPEVLRPAAGDTFSVGLGINDDGSVSGNTQPNASQNPFFPALWSGAPTPRLLTTTPALPWGTAYVINGSGEAAGELDSTDGNTGHAVVWTPAGRLVDLVGLPGGQQNTALGIAQNGWVVGVSLTFPPDGGPPSFADSFFWPGHGRLRILPTLQGPGIGFSSVHGIDSDGSASGFSTDNTGATRPTVWRCVQNLPAAPGQPETVTGAPPNGSALPQPTPRMSVMAWKLEQRQRSPRLALGALATRDWSASTEKSAR
jgi:uncharacterized membrane protein